MHCSSTECFTFVMEVGLIGYVLLTVLLPKDHSILLAEVHTHI